MVITEGARPYDPRAARIPNLNLDVTSVLNNFAYQQRQNGIALFKDGDLSEDPSGEELLSFYEKTRLFDNFYAQALEANFDQEIPSERLRQRAAGRIFADIAFIWLRHSTASLPDTTVLPEAQTRDLYQRIYPNAQMAYNPFGQSSLMGVTVPDGVIIQGRGKEIKVSNVCEYKASTNNRESIVRALDAYYGGKEKFPRLLGDSQFTLVTSFGHDKNLEIVDGSVLELVRVPLSTGELENFVNYVFREFGLDATSRKE